MSLVTWIPAGAILGGTASALVGTRDRRGLALNVVTGITGVMSGGWLLSGLIGSSAFNLGDFSLASLLVSLLGATVLLTVLQALRGGVTGQTPTRHDDAPAAFEVTGSGNLQQSERTEMNERPGAGRVLRPLITVGLAGILMLVGACASAPLAPDSALNAAKVAISNAEKADAGQFAGAELGEARERLALADNAVRDEDMVAAERFARESQVQAELASARTAAAKAAAVNKDMERGTEAMTEEMQRAGEPR